MVQVVKQTFSDGSTFWQCGWWIQPHLYLRSSGNTEVFQANKEAPLVPQEVKTLEAGDCPSEHNLPVHGLPPV